MIKTQFNIHIKIIRLDNTLEFKFQKWNDFIKSKGIICEYISPYSHVQNGIAERLNRYIIEGLICITNEMDIPLFL
jgi:hypothetical protein